VTSGDTAAAILDSRFENLHVLNLGVSGYGIGQYYLHLKRQLEHPSQLLAPAWIVVTIFTGNDYFDTIANVRYGKSKPLFILDVESSAATKQGAVQAPRGSAPLIRLEQETISRYSCNNLLSKSWILSRGSLRKIQSRICPSRTLSDGEAAAVIDELLTKIHDLALVHGARVLFVLHPSNQDFKYANEAIFERAVAAGEASQISIAVAKGRVFFKSALAGLGYDSVDFSKSVREAGRDLREIYLDIAHLTPKGNRLLADAIAERLEGQLEVEH
jgi:lysophospholipase L1-like esterase